MPKPTSDCRATERKHPWPMVRLGELGTMVRGNGIKRSETIETGFPCLRYGEIYTSFDVILDKPKSFVPKELFDRSVKIKKGDLVFTLTGENTEEIAKALAYLGDDEIAAGGDLAVWTGHGCDSKYLAYLMYSPQLISQKAATGNGNIVVHTSIKKLQQIEIPLPSLSVQREIVARLERELAAVEKMKKGFETLAETAKAEFKAELKEVFEEISCGGAYPPAEGCPRSGCPSRGEPRRLGDVCEVVCGKTPLRSNSRFWSNGNVPWFTIDDLRAQGRDIRATDKCITEEAASFMRIIPSDTVLLCCTASIGACCIARIPLTTNQQFNALIVRDKNILIADYLYYFCLGLTPVLNELSSKTTIDFVSKTKVENIEFPLPSLAVQREVVARLDEAKAKAEKLESKAREGVAVCETMRKAILKEAFEGG